MGELGADGGGDLGEPQVDRRGFEPARHQLLEPVGQVLVGDCALVEHRAGQLLDEQRDALGPLDDRRSVPARAGGLAGEVVDNLAGDGLLEPTEGTLTA